MNKAVKWSERLVTQLGRFALGWYMGRAKLVVRAGHENDRPAVIRYMMKRSAIRSGVMLMCVLGSLAANAQGGVVPSKGKEFWLGFMKNWTGVVPPYVVELFISAPVNTSGVVHMPLLGEQWPFVVEANVTTRIALPVGMAIHQGSEFIDSRSILVRSEDTVSVFAINYEPFSSDGALVYPVQALGIDYRIFAYTGIGTNNSVSEFLIVATKDDTEVEITPTALTAGGRSAGSPWVVRLDSGQTYQVQAFHPTGDLTGTRIRGTDASGSCRPFAVFSGSVCANVPTDCTACDHLYEQNLPVAAWGRRYHAVPFSSTTSYMYRVLAHENGTQVSINGASPMVLNAGQYHDVNTMTADACFEGDRPFAVAQFMKGKQCVSAGDPSLLILNADEQQLSDITFSTVHSNVITEHYLNIVTATQDISQLTLNGESLSATEFTPFLACPSRSYARISIPQGSHTLVSSAGFTAYVYGTGVDESYAYSVGAFNPIPPVEVDSVVCVDGKEGPVTLVVPRPLDDPYWTTAADPGTILHQGPTYTFTPQTSGTYVVTGTEFVSRCTRQYHFSVELSEPPTITASSGAGEVCANSEVALRVVVDPPGEYGYAWTPSVGLSDPEVAEPTASPMATTWYRVSVSTMNGCAMAMDSVLVQVTPSNVLGHAALPGDTTLCTGQTVELEAFVLRILAQDPLNTSVGPMWQNIQGGVLNTDCGSVTGNALHFNGEPVRWAETVPLNMSNGGAVRFALIIGTGDAPCEDADPGDDVVLEYSVDGLSWEVFATYPEWAYPEFSIIKEEVPSSAWTNATRFRWRQLGTWTTGTDNWALDDVVIAARDNSQLLHQWSPTTGLDDPLSAFPIASPSGTITYVLTSTDPLNGCVYMDTMHIQVGVPPGVLPEKAYLCPGEVVVLDASAAGTGDYSWNTGTTGPLLEVGEPGMYWVEMRTEHGCGVDSVEVVVAPQIGPLDLEVVGCEGRGKTIALPVGGSDHLWSTGETTPSIVVIDEGEYSVAFVDEHGCVADARVTVRDMEAGEVDGMPNVFSPNGDGVNDLFLPLEGTLLDEGDLKVFNRWGQLVHEGSGTGLGWDGHVVGGPAPEGTYFFTVRFRSLCTEEVVSRTGHVTLLR